MRNESVYFLLCVIVSCTIMSRKTAMLISAIFKRSKLPCPHCGERVVDVGKSDYFIPTLARRTCPKCAGEYRRPRAQGLTLLCVFIALLFIIWKFAPEPLCYWLFIGECLLMTLCGVLIYKPEAVQARQTDNQ